MDINRDMPQRQQLKERPYATGLRELKTDVLRNELLPTDALLIGFELHSLEFNQDPYVLYDVQGHIIHEWPCGYEPHWTEVYEVCKRNIK